MKYTILLITVLTLAGCKRHVLNKDVLEHIKKDCRDSDGQIYVGYIDNVLGVWSMEVGCIYPKKGEDNE